MMSKKVPLTDPEQVPENMTEAQARDFWQTHSVTEDYLAKREVNEDDLPPARPRRCMARRSV